jgi:hypothetical protein
LRSGLMTENPMLYSDSQALIRSRGVEKLWSRYTLRLTLILKVVGRDFISHLSHLFSRLSTPLRDSFLVRFHWLLFYTKSISHVFVFLASARYGSFLLEGSIIGRRIFLIFLLTLNIAKLTVSWNLQCNASILHYLIVS